MLNRHQPALWKAPAQRVEQTLARAPRRLPSDSQERQRLLGRKLRSTDPVAMAEVVRDLASRQRTGQAGPPDLRLLHRADRELARWLAAQTGEPAACARRRMWGIVHRTISRLV